MTRNRPISDAPRHAAARVTAGALISLLALAATGCGKKEEAAPTSVEAATPQVATSAPPQSLAPTAGAVSPQLVAALFDQLGPDVTTASTPIPDPASFSAADPNWPVLAYLAGESQLRQGDRIKARAAFRDLATWAAGAIPGTGDKAAAPTDGWGGSGLAAVALWRWVQLLESDGGDATEIDAVLRVAPSIQSSRLFAAMVRSGLLPALPLLEEDLARRLAHVASKAGRPEAMSLFLDFVSIDSSGELDDTDRQIIATMIEKGLVTADRLNLFRYRRQLSLVKTQSHKESVAAELRKLWETDAGPKDVRAEAGYEWGNFYRRNKQRKPAVIAALTSAYELSGGTGPIAEKALYQRAMVQGSVEPVRSDLFFADMARLQEAYPRGRLTDDAIYQVASEKLLGAPADFDGAFADYERLRAFDGTNDWQDSAYFLPALGYIDRGTDSDLQAADKLLAEYLERYPQGVFRQRCHFWRGRIAEAKGDTTAARVLFEEAVKDSPYTYHGLRAQLHLEFGRDAIHMALPPPDSQSFAKLRTAYRDSKRDAQVTGDTPYHARLKSTAENGVYAKALGVVNGIGPRLRNRLDGIALKDLDAKRLIPAAAVLLALRQDALAARDVLPGPDNQLRLAGFVGQQLSDWPTAMMMLATPGASHESLAALQGDPRYLATAYPDPAALGGLRTILDRAAWPIDGSKTLSETLMYAVIRRESAYFPGAISPVGALGLFQIMPLTFKARRNCWQRHPTTSEPTPASYLFNPERNVQFWSCWVRKEFAPKTRDEIAEMLIRHHAGTGHLSEWRATWRGRAIENDPEMQIEVLRFPATQLFVRHVLADTAIANAGGLFETAAAGGSQ